MAGHGNLGDDKEIDPFKVENVHKKLNFVERISISILAVSLMGHMLQWEWDDKLTILDVRKFKPIHRRKFTCEVNEIACNVTGDSSF
ncbi:hypothetical protein ACH5RR_029175 [Cinchona calisaya]|uniref:Uncharacterized protein n=1 Tax=Cinchona calisaya TaxID=153742 RepID=A0ABD2YQW4_9GENT